MCIELLPAGGYPTAINKIYHIISYHIISYLRKTVGHVFTKQTVQIEGATQKFFFSQEVVFFIVVHISAARR
jgi:hypothetical protein